MQVSRHGIDKFIQRYLQTGTIARKPGSGHPSRITSEMGAIVEEQMHLDDETTAVPCISEVQRIQYFFEDDFLLSHLLGADLSRKCSLTGPGSQQASRIGLGQSE